MTFKRCRQCDQPLHKDRQDAEFCSKRCGAQWARENGEYRQDFHETKNRVHDHTCEWCGAHFATTDYAQRQGKRTPKYCSDRCRVAAYRARKTGASKPGYSNPGKTSEEKRQWENFFNWARGFTGEQKTQARGSKTFWEGFQSQYAGAMACLGLSSSFTMTTLKKAWKNRLKVVHPDICKEPDAVWLTQQANWAYEYLKTTVAK